MDRNQVYRLARTLMDEHGLTDWKIGWIRSAHRAGQCNYTTRTIELSLKKAEVRTDNDTRMTILHEIAHALVGPYHSHDWVWQRKCLEIGGNGKAKHTQTTEESVALAKWVGTCPNGHVTTRQARSKKMFDVSCGRCSRVYNPAYKYTWMEKSTGQVHGGPADTGVALRAAANATAAPRPAPIAPPARGAFDKGFTDIEALFAGD